MPLNQKMLEEELKVAMEKEGWDLKNGSGETIAKLIALVIPHIIKNITVASPQGPCVVS